MTVALLAGEIFTLASRDSLLALAQSIEAALLLESHGAKVKILTLKTSGDIKLDAPLYDVAAAAAPKEGRAFFTRELDDALQSGKADIAVHSFKDLPTEPVAGVSDPLFFSEQTGADILVSVDASSELTNPDRLTIGTSSLRRIHQLRHAMPGANAVTLRGNIVTRLRKLRRGEAGMNAILIAGAGIFRVRQFSKLPAESYTQLIEPAIAEKISAELAEFRSYLDEGVTIRELGEMLFPTAPGQGVLALQMNAACEKRIGDRLRTIFADHEQIAARVGLERHLMTALGTGCHAPLGVSALRDQGHLQIAVCYSRKSESSPPSFADSIYLRRQVKGLAGPLVEESLRGFERFFWWGLSEPPASQSQKWIFIRALNQNLLHPTLSDIAQYDHIFVSSKTAADWLKGKAPAEATAIWAAGQETANDVSRAHAGRQVQSCTEKGFAAAYADIRRLGNGKILWLGSESGLKRAKLIADEDPQIDYLCVYENQPAEADALRAQFSALTEVSASQGALHCLTSRASAEAFVRFARSLKDAAWHISCFGESAAELVAAEGFEVYHLSKANAFGEYLREIEGDTTLMKITQGITNETKTI